MSTGVREDTPAQDVQQVELSIGGMTCAAGAARIERRLNKVDGVTATVNFATEKAGVSFPAELSPWTYDGARPGSELRVQAGDQLRFGVGGHTFAVRAPTSAGARTDTVIVLPDEAVEVDLQADNPGQWMVHCHNAYRQEAGMMTVLSYVAG